MWVIFIFLQLTWHFLDFKIEYGNSVCWPNNKRINYLTNSARDLFAVFRFWYLDKHVCRKLPTGGLRILDERERDGIEEIRDAPVRQMKWADTIFCLYLNFLSPQSKRSIILVTLSPTRERIAKSPRWRRSISHRWNGTERAPQKRRGHVWLKCENVLTREKWCFDH